MGFEGMMKGSNFYDSSSEEMVRKRERDEEVIFKTLEERGYLDNNNYDVDLDTAIMSESFDCPSCHSKVIAFSAKRKSDSIMERRFCCIDSNCDYDQIEFESGV